MNAFDNLTNPNATAEQSKRLGQVRHCQNVVTITKTNGCTPKNTSYMYMMCYIMLLKEYGKSQWIQQL